MRNTILYFTFIICVLNGCSDNSEEPSSSPIPEFTQIDFEPAWSSNGSSIVYAHSNLDNDLSGIYIIDANGNNNTQIVSGFSRSPDLSKDGNWIAFSQFNQIYKKNLSNDSIVQLTFSGKNFFPKWSFDDSLISYSNTECAGSNTCGVWIMSNYGEQQTLFQANANYPNWVNSNSLIYFMPVKNNENVQTGDSCVQYFLNTNSSQTIATLNDNEHRVNSYPCYAGDEIIFCSMDNEGYNYIYKMRTDGSNIMKLTETQGYSPAFSFANQKIVYTNRNSGNGRLWIMDKNGNNKMQLTN